MLLACITELASFLTAETSLAALLVTKPETDAHLALAGCCPDPGLRQHLQRRVDDEAPQPCREAGLSNTLPVRLILEHGNRGLCVWRDAVLLRASFRKCLAGWLTRTW